MESLSMDDDRLSFLRSTPFSFSLYNRDGPNRVEIFDITRIPTCRSAISETTCLCDIFGDDCESPTLSSSPPTGSLAKVEEDKFARADDSPNDSPGSYHTANGSEQLSDSSDTFEDSKDVLSPVPPPTASLPEARGASPLSKSNGLSPDPQTTPPSAQSKGTASSPRSVAPLSLSPEPRSANISPKHRTTASPHTPSIKFPSLEASCSGLSSEHRSIDISPKSEATATPYKHRSTAPSPAPRDTDVFYEATDTTPTPEDWDVRHTTEPRGTEPRITAIPPEPRSISPELQHRVKPSRPEPSVASLQTEYKPSSLELELRAEIPDSEPRNTSPKPEPRALSAEPEPRATFSEPGPRAISPEIKPRTTSPKQELSAASTEPESRVVSSKLEPSVTSLEPEPRDKSPVIKPRAIFPLKELSAILPEPEPSATSPEPEFRTQFPEPKSSDTSPEPEPSTTSPEPEFRTLSPEPEPSATSPQQECCAASPEPEFQTQFPELEPSAISSEPEFRTPSPESKPSATSPEPDFKAPYPEAELSAASPEPEFRTPSPEQEPSATSPEPEFRTPSPEQEPSATYPEPECRTPSPEQEPSATYPEPEFRTQYPEPEPSATSPEPEFRTPSPEPEPSATSTEPEPSATSTEPEPSATSSEPEFRTPSPEPEPSATSTEPEPSATSSEPEFRTKSPESESSATSSKSEPRSTYPELNTICPSPEGTISASSPKPRGLVVSLKPNATFSSAESIETVLLRETTITAHTAESKASSPTQEPRIKDPSHEPRQTNPSLEMRSTNLSLESKTATHGLETWCSTASPEPPSTVNSREQRNSEISSEPRRPTISAECKNPELFKLTGHAAEHSGTAAVLELGDRDQLLKPTTEPTDTSCPPKPCEREEGRMTAVLANSNAGEGLQSAQPLFASETVSIRPPGNRKSEAGPSEETAAEGPGLISAPREPGVSTSGESPTVQPRQGDNSQPHRDKGQREGGEEEEEEHKIEERGADEGEGSREKASYEEQQVELSFSARNRRAPVSPSSAPTCRQLRTGMPAGCYSDCLLVTQQQQQQNPLRTLSSQKENQARARKPRPIPRPTRSSASQRPAPEYSSETSSMGSELDEADDEVKWFTDQAFRSLSSPQADYLDVYNSSHRSSTNVSQLSTEDSPGATAWSAYADLQGSIRHDGDNLPHQPPAGLAPDRLDATRRFEMGSFECVDVALESREDVRRGKRTVPKRQIQLKRRDTSESQVSENDEAATDAANEAAPGQRHSRDALLRQHSTPAAVHEESCKEVKPEPGDRKQKLQKSLSLDETSSKTKTASCLIKSVLSKKMQHNQTLAISQPSLQSGDSSSAVGKNASPESSHSVTETPKMEGSNLSSELPSDCSLSEEDLPLQVESAPQSSSVKQHRSFDPKPQPKPLGRYGYSPLQSGASSLEFQKNNTGKQGMRSELVIPFESPKTEKRSGREMWKQSSRETEKQSNKEMDKQRGSVWKQGNGGVEKQRGRDWVKLPSDENLCEKHSGDSANAVSGNTGAAATRAPGAPGGMTNRNQECYTTRSENYKQQSARSTFMSKTPEIMLKPCTAREKKKSSLTMDCLSGDSAPKQEESRVAPSPGRLPEKETHERETESKTGDRPENGEAFEKNRPRAPVHKVRDVRKLVKNTYNLSFKATAVPAQDSAPWAEVVEKPPPMQIEYVSRKVEGLATGRPGERQAEGEKAQVPVQVHSQEPTQVSAQVHPQVPVQVHSQEPTQVSAQVHPQGPPQVSAQVQPQVPVQMPPQKVTQTASLHITPRGRLSEAGAAAPDTAATEANTSGVSEPASRTEKVPGGGTRHPKLGSTPKLPSKDREVSTLMFLQNGLPEGGLEPGALPPLALTATSCSRSVSMLLKEKGFQADIGVCDAPADDPNATEKHVNTLEVPLQTCSAEGASSEPSDPVPPPARSSPSAPTPLMDPKEERHPRNPTPPQLREMDLERTSLKPRENNTGAQDPTPSSPQTPAATSSDRPRLTHVKTVSTCTRKPAPAAAGSPTSSCKQQSASAAAQLHSSDTQTSAPLAASSKENQPALSAISSCKQKPPLTSSPEQPNLTHSDAQEQVALVSSCSSSCSQSSVSTASQSPSCSQQSTISITSTKRIESSNLRYYASDDPPSYDERESFSPLLLTDLYSRKPNRYHPPVQAPPCSCAADGVPCPGPPDITPLVPGPSTAQAPPSHTQAPPSLAAPPPARHHHQRSDGRSLSYKPGSPKGAPPSLAQAPPHPFQPLHHPPPGLPACPPLLPQPRPENSRQPPPGQQADRRPGQQRSPQHPASLSGSSTYSSHSTHSPGVPPLEVRPQYLCTPPGFVSPYGSEYGGEGGGGGGMLYPEGGGGLGYGQSPRRVLLDPETGKYFYIEVPMQPLRKMLFDPETGQYVEVLIPQQTLSHSGLYPPVAAPYPSMHNPGMYAPQYLPYSVPPHSQPPSPRHAEAPPPQGLHQSNGGFGTPSNRSPKTEPQNHPPLDQGYLESMYYIPTGMTASPNPAPPEFYQKLPPSLPNSGGKRS
ncbi:protein piccolo [Anguilla rostrata]|uniref:protein piccolo n=1 Tax=Anguilla rostrata TaxID=7938 RepID=UPI0030D0F5EE